MNNAFSLKPYLSGRRGVALLLIVTVILTGIGFWFFPWISDDIGFRLPFRSYFANGGVPSFDELLAECRSKYLYDNGRFSNVTMVFIEFTPHWVQVALSMLALMAILFYGVGIMQARESKLWTAFWIATIVLFAPWTDKMYVFNFQINYLWSTALGICLCYMILNKDSSLSVISIVALLTGLWQEAVGFPLFIGLIILWLVCPDMRDRRTVVAILLLFVGLLWLYSSPGGRIYRDHGHPYHSRIFMLLPYAVPAILALILWLRRRNTEPKLLLLVSSSIASAALMIYAGYGARVGWWSAVGGGLAVLIMLKDRGYMDRFSQRSVNIFICMVLLFVSVHLGFVARYCYLEGREYDYIISQYREAPTETVFANMYMHNDVPWICMQKPTYAIFTHLALLSQFGRFYAPGAPPPKVVPRQLAQYKIAQANPIDGNGDFTEYNGYIVGPWQCDSIMEPVYIVTQGSSAKTRSMLHVPFTDAEGHRRAWYKLNSPDLSDFFYPIPANIDRL